MELAREISRDLSRAIPAWRWGLVVVGVYMVAALAITYPLITTLSHGIPYEPAHDQLYQLSLLEFQTSSLLSNPGHFFSGNIFYGSGDALYSSDLLLGVLTLFAPLRLITGQALLAFNITYIAAFVLNGLSMYWAGSLLTRSRAGALVAGTVFSFGAIQLNYAFHLQLLAAWWLPLVIVFSIRFSRSLDWRYFCLAVAMIWIQFLTAVHLGLLAGFAFLVFAGPTVAVSITRFRDWQRISGSIVAGSLISLPFIPFVLGYLHYADLWHGERSLAEIQFWATELKDYLSPTTRLQWHDTLRTRFPMPHFERTVFPGLVPMLLGLLGIGSVGWAFRVSGYRANTASIAVLLLLLLGLILSLGTHWKWNGSLTSVELPYLFLFEHFPVFRAIRVVARFSLLVHLSIALLSAIGIAWLDRYRLSSKLQFPVVGFFAALLILGETMPERLPVHSLNDRSQLVNVLREVGPGPTLFVPVHLTEVDWRYGEEAEIERMWIAAQSGVGPLVNGYSGYIWDKLEYFKDATADRSIRDAGGLAEALQAYGIRHVVLRMPSIQRHDISMWTAFLGSDSVESLREADNYVIATLKEERWSADFSWNDLSGRFLIDSIGIGHDVITALVVQVDSGEAWVPPGGSYAHNLEIIWLDLDGRTVSRSLDSWEPPPFFEPEQLEVIPVHLSAPPISGEYQMVAYVDGNPILAQPVTVMNQSKRPFQGSAEGLDAKLELRKPEYVDAFLGEEFLLHVDAVNIGKVDWSGEANIRLGWQWFERVDDETLHKSSTPEGRLPLLNNIYGVVPVGSGHPFVGSIALPEIPGHYVMKIGMVSELVAWFPKEKIQIQVTVHNPDGDTRADNAIIP